MRFLKTVYFFIALFLLAQCATKVLRYEKVEELQKIQEFDNTVKIETAEVPPEAIPEASSMPALGKDIQKRSDLTKESPKPIKKPQRASSKTSEKSKTQKETLPPPRRQPELESDVGFSGRRPIKDPFRVGEKVVHSVNYFKMRAGYLNLETKPFAQVNGRKSYQFEIAIRTSDFFSSFYSVDDRLVTWMDYEDLVPSVFQLHVRESAQIREARSFFDFEKNRATFWEKKVTEKDGETNTKEEWEILDFSQNVYSAAFYLRFFQWKVGTENAFRVANDSENLIFRAKAIRKEKLSTDIGTFDTIVIKPEIELKGKFKPVGDIFIWLSDDDRRYILRIESKIRIGTLVSEVIELNPGRD